MIKRTKEIKLRLSEEELQVLNDKANLCKCSREKFSRLVLFDAVPAVPPPVEYYKLLKEWNAIGNNINQLVKLAYVQKINDLPIGSAMVELSNLIKLSEEKIRGSG